ncbi:MAG: hypothetical protein K0Q79_3061 [Flavipsychrobacter sp.]|jgi:hypothetical protein|nr:hypothetical protein [Flavipsychrobacter sp.]
MRQFDNPTIRQGRNLVIIALVGLWLATGCEDKSKHLPSDVMEKVLTDITLAEGYATLIRDSLHPPGTKNYDSLGVLYKHVFAHYKITEKQFNESLKWYRDHPNELDSIFTRMQVVITQKSPPVKQTAPQIPPPMPSLPAPVN